MLRDFLRANSVRCQNRSPVRERISVEDWKILVPVTNSRQALVLMFTSPLDWALLQQTIAIESADGLVIGGRGGSVNKKDDGASHQHHLGSQAYITYALIQS